MIISNNSNSYKYFNSIESSLLNNGFDFLNSDSISSSNIIAHINNLSLGIERPDIYHQVVKNIYPIPPHSIWKYQAQIFELVDQSSMPLIANPNNLEDFIDLVKSKIKLLKNKRIAIELSGGLDSSIIIELLNLCGLEITLIGLVSSNYEFRTERIIQNHYRSEHKSFLINSKDALPFSKLLECPPHHLPDKKSLFFNQKKIIAEKCSDEKINYLFNGIAGDSIFSDKIETKRWHQWGFDNDGFNYNIFKPQDIYYQTTNFDFILNYFFNARKKEESDPYKVWARDHFKNYLPQTLSKYYYKADHFEEILEGLYSSESDLNEIYNFAYSVQKNDYFRSIGLGYDLKNFKRMNETEVNAFFAKSSFALWIYSLRNMI
jgi:hypothetical protein